MKCVNPKIYDKNFYLSLCLGSEEYKKSKGGKLHPRVLNLLKKINVNKKMRVLDIGCGRGDITMFLAKNAKECIGIDYSKDAIEIANSTKKIYPKNIQEKSKFYVMDAKKMNFPDSYFDVVVSIDVLEHLYKEEAEISMKEISRVLRKNGVLFLRTVTNRILYDYTYKYYILPLNKILTKLDGIFRKKSYGSLPKDPRIPEEKQQHVNEPTYFYLKNIFDRFGFKGEIEIEIGYLKEVKGFKTVIYNFLITLYPLSRLFPLNLLFGWAFICKMKKTKDFDNNS